MYTILLLTRSELADEQTGREETDALGQDVLGHDVDEGREQDEGHGGLVDEEEGDELRHGRLENRLLSLLAWSNPLLYPDCGSYHLLGSHLRLLRLALGRREGWARHNGGADEGGLAEGGPRERAEKAGRVHGGLCGRRRVSALLQRSNGRGTASAREIDAPNGCFEARGDGGDGLRSGRGSVVKSSAKLSLRRATGPSREEPHCLLS